MTDMASPEILFLLQTVAQRMTRSGLRVATAESCTGGQLAQWMTTLPGSSEWFECGWVAYSDASKTGLLQVPPEVVKRHGAVSEQTVEQMAAGVFRCCSANLAVAITGVAGPSGGSASKPVGTVYVALAKRDQPTCTVHRVFQGSRTEIRNQSVILALTLLRDHCED